MDRYASWCKSVLVSGLVVATVAFVLGGAAKALGHGAHSAWLSSLATWTMITTPLAALVVSASLRGWGAFARAVAVVLVIGVAIIAEIVR